MQGVWAGSPQRRLRLESGTLLRVQESPGRCVQVGWEATTDGVVQAGGRARFSAAGIAWGLEGSDGSVAGGKRGKFDLLQFVETTECSSSVLQDAVLEMMTEEELRG